MQWNRFQLGPVFLDALDLDGVLNAIELLIHRGQGGSVLTPNCHHVIWAQKLPALKKAYDDASLCLVDDTPLYWMTRLLGQKIPQKVSGSDLIGPLMQRAALRGWRVYLMGGGPGVAQEAAQKLRVQFPTLNIVGCGAPDIAANPEAPHNRLPLSDIQRAQPDIILTALGCPKQELWIDYYRSEYAPAIAFGIGASLDFISGRMKRAPKIFSALALEGLFRLLQEPRRLWYRYLIESPQILPILWRSLKQSKNKPQHTVQLLEDVRAA